MLASSILHTGICVFFVSFNIIRENPRGFRSGGIWFLFHGIWFLSRVIMCSDFYQLFNQFNLFMVINIWGIIIIYISFALVYFLYLHTKYNVYKIKCIVMYTTVQVRSEFGKFAYTAICMRNVYTLIW
jgi:hypothetical protein